jgi:hypothetical protein
MTEVTHPPRVFTEDAEPPFGERITMTTLAGDVLTWTGKRWHWDTGHADLQLHDAWPPDVEGPYAEVPRG